VTIHQDYSLNSKHNVKRLRSL